MLKRNIPHIQVNLPGSFWGITSFFNPADYNNKLENYRLFRANSKRQGLKLIAVELAFGDKAFDLNSDDADILVQLRGSEKNIIWQKEALLNIALRHLPADCDKVAWLDCDIIFKNEYWIKETSGLLEKYVMVQPFSKAVRLPQGIRDLTEEEINVLPYGRNIGQKIFGFGYLFTTSASDIGHEGFAWAIRKDIIIRHSLYDRLFTGSADTAMISLFSDSRRFKDLRWTIFNPKMLAHYLRWGDAIKKDIQRCMWYADGPLLHLWHGDIKERLFLFRYKILNLYNFDPRKDVQLSPNGLLEWASDKPKLHQAVKEYFKFRNEEGKSVLTPIMVDELHHTTQELARIKSSNTYKIASVLSKMFNFIFFLPGLKRAAIRAFDKMAD